MPVAAIVPVLLPGAYDAGTAERGYYNTITGDHS